MGNGGSPVAAEMFETANVVMGIPNVLERNAKLSGRFPIFLTAECLFSQTASADKQGSPFLYLPSGISKTHADKPVMSGNSMPLECLSLPSASGTLDIATVAIGARYEQVGLIALDTGASF